MCRQKYKASGKNEQGASCGEEGKRYSMASILLPRSEEMGAPHCSLPGRRLASCLHEVFSRKPEGIDQCATLLLPVRECIEKIGKKWNSKVSD